MDRLWYNIETLLMHNSNTPSHYKGETPTLPLVIKVKQLEHTFSFFRGFLFGSVKKGVHMVGVLIHISGVFFSRVAFFGVMAILFALRAVAIRALGRSMARLIAYWALSIGAIPDDVALFVACKAFDGPFFLYWIFPAFFWYLYVLVRTVTASATVSFCKISANSLLISDVKCIVGSARVSFSASLWISVFQF